MIKGIGLDITELDRIEKLVKRQPSFVTRILTKNEKVSYDKLQGKRQIEFLAGRFSAKEAYSKALGTGIGKELSFQDIEVLNEHSGKPVLYVLNRNDNKDIHVSISHSQHYVVTQVIIESSSS
ncbi:holo-ACP synthase [Bacillus sp. 1780r2a1]|nr:holo-ACP synthase [Bacillus sp. 1780r2a1]